MKRGDRDSLTADMFKPWTEYHQRAVAAGKSFISKRKATERLAYPIVESFGAVEPEHISVIEVLVQGKATSATVYVVSEEKEKDSEDVVRYIVMTSAMAIAAKKNKRMAKFIEEDEKESEEETESRPAKAVERAEKSVDEEKAKSSAAVPQALQRLYQRDVEEILSVDLSDSDYKGVGGCFADAREAISLMVDSAHMLETCKARYMAQRLKDKDSDVTIDPFSKSETRAQKKHQK